MPERIGFLGLMVALCIWCWQLGMLDAVFYCGVLAAAFTLVWTLEEWR